MNKKVQPGEVTALTHEFADWSGFMPHVVPPAGKQVNEGQSSGFQPQDWTNDGWPCEVQAW